MIKMRNTNMKLKKVGELPEKHNPNCPKCKRRLRKNVEIIPGIWAFSYEDSGAAFAQQVEFDKEKITYVCDKCEDIYEEIK